MTELTPRYPEGTAEYERYRAELAGELAKWAAGEPPYELDEEDYPHDADSR